jgi:hypothetical protein
LFGRILVVAFVITDLGGLALSIAGPLLSRSTTRGHMKTRTAAFQPFSGALSVANATKATQLLQTNAARLVKDAKLLLQAGRHASAAMLAAMALEEMARVFFPLELVTIDRDGRREDCWKRFRGPRHEFPWAVFHPKPDLGGEANLNDMLSFINTLGRRTDCIEPGIWLDPAEMISPELADAVVGTAERFCNNPIGSRSMEIWVEVATSLPSNASTKTALKKYQSMLETEGLAAEASFVADINARYDSIRNQLGQTREYRS